MEAKKVSVKASLRWRHGHGIQGINPAKPSVLVWWPRPILLPKIPLERRPEKPLIKRALILTPALFTKGG